jgi:Na+/melibiose symporter-like transporter
MKLYLDYKNQFNFIIVGSILLIFAISFFPVFSFAQTAAELQDKINQKDADIAKLEEEIKVYFENRRFIRAPGFDGGRRHKKNK